jgi:hypothetical protein
MAEASEHAEALTAILTRDLHLSTVEIDEFWPFVRTKTVCLRKLMLANAGDALCKIAPAASSPPARLGASVTIWSSEGCPHRHMHARP